MSKTEKTIEQIEIRRPYITQTIFMEINHEVYVPVKETNSRTKEADIIAEADFKTRLDNKSVSQKPKRRQRTASCLTLCNFPNYVENAEAAATLFLLVLLIQVAHLLVGIVTAMPAIYLDCAPLAAVPVLNALLQAIQGPDKWTGKGWKLQRPHIIRPQLSLSETRPSQNLQDYIGGTFKNCCGEKQKFHFPLICSSAVLLPGVPSSVKQEIMQISPLALLISFERNKNADTRPCFELTASGFDSYDTKAIKKFSKRAADCYWGLEKFLEWFCGKTKNIERWQDEIDRFRPVTHKGHFTTPKSDNRTEWLCAGLSLFQQYLYFASEKKEWITTEEAHDFLLRYWRLVLPESAPSVEGNQQDGQCLAYESPEAFYRFLAEYFLPTYHSQVLYGTTGEQGTMALVRKLDGEEFFITPRMQFLETYAQWLKSQHSPSFDLSVSKGETAVQRKLLEAGIPLRGEKNNPSTWRYPFYGKQKGMVNCLALPVGQFPEPAQSAFENLIGTGSGTAAAPNRTEPAPDGQKGVEVL